MSPEYAMDGVFSMKSDIYSFGVMVLEIITGKRNRGFYEVELDLNLLRYVSSTNMYQQRLIATIFFFLNSFSNDASWSLFRHGCCGKKAGALIYLTR